MTSKVLPKVLNAKLNLGENSVEIKNIRKCRGLMKGKGLMFIPKEKARPLLFEFSGDVSRSISSLFCPPFLAVWLDEHNRIIDYKIVSPNKISIRPDKPFRKLVEVPLNNKYSEVIQFVLDNGKV